MNGETVPEKDGWITLVVFRVGELLCAMDIADVDEIKRVFNVTRVHHAPHYISGVVNIRGQIVTVIDLKKKLSIDDSGPEARPAMVIVRKENEQIGILVDAIIDTVNADASTIEKPPANIGEQFGAFLSGVYKTDQALIGILDRMAVVELDFDREEQHLTDPVNRNV